MKKIIILSIILLPLLTGCYNYRELNNLSIVTAISIEKNNDLYKGIVSKTTTENSDICKFSYNELIKNNLMDEGTINPLTNKSISEEDYYIIVSNKNGKYKYNLKQLSNDKENYEECINE